MSVAAGGSRRLSIVRRSAAGLSVAGIATAVILTGTAASSAAPNTVKAPAAARNATTLDGGTASSAGKMTVIVTDVRRRGGALTLTSVRYAGGATVTAKNPALILTIAPAGPCLGARRTAAIASASLAAGGPKPVRCPGPGRRHERILILAIRLRLHTLASFSGKLPASIIKSINAHGGIPAGELLTTTLASITTSKSHHHRVIQAREYMQVGILVSPGRFF